MTRVERCKAYLDSLDPLSPRLIDVGDLITCDAVEYLKYCSSADISKLFTTYPGGRKILKANGGGVYQVEIRCSSCGIEKVVPMRLTDIRRYLGLEFYSLKISKEEMDRYHLGKGSMNVFFKEAGLCSDCVEKRKKRRLEEKTVGYRRLSQYSETNKKTVTDVAERGKDLIDFFLSSSPDILFLSFPWSRVIREKLFLTFGAFIKQLTPEEEEMMRRRILSMSYKDFLKTLYWKILSYKVKEKAKNECAVCGSHDNLAAHHKYYKIHGFEHRHWETGLTCLCEKCHSKFHDKIPEDDVKSGSIIGTKSLISDLVN